MNYYILVFWSRSDALGFVNAMKKGGAPSALISTPREAGRTCGLSVKILPEYYDLAQKILGMIRFSSFGGVFGESMRNGVKTIVKL